MEHMPASKHLAVARRQLLIEMYIVINKALHFGRLLAAKVGDAMGLSYEVLSLCSPRVRLSCCFMHHLGHELTCCKEAQDIARGGQWLRDPLANSYLNSYGPKVLAAMAGVLPKKRGVAYYHWRFQIEVPADLLSLVFTKLAALQAVRQAVVCTDTGLACKEREMSFEDSCMCELRMDSLQLLVATVQSRMCAHGAGAGGARPEGCPLVHRVRGRTALPGDAAGAGRPAPRDRAGVV